jgi:hypothetical protein
MSVGDKLGLEADGDRGLLAVAGMRWPDWVAADPRLGVVPEFGELRDWIASVPWDASDEVLLALAMLAAPDGGDDLAAAGALVKCLLPGACRLAASLTAMTPTGFRGHQPATATARGDWIDELVAAQLWIEVRSFPWRRRRKVAANILADTRAGCLRELGSHSQLIRVDRAWANTTVVDDRGGDGLALMSQPASVVGGAGGPGGGELSAAEELLEVLDQARAKDIISEADRVLLLCLVAEADQVSLRGRGFGGLLSDEVSELVAGQVGVSPRTVRRHAGRAVKALAGATPGNRGAEAQKLAGVG